MINEERLVSLFKSLCLINAPSLKEKESVAWTKAYLEKIPGLEVGRSGGMAIGGQREQSNRETVGNKPDAPRIFLSAHFDTVEPTPGLVIGERDGLFYSDSDIDSWRR